MALFMCKVCKKQENSRALQNCPSCGDYVCKDCYNKYNGCNECQNISNLKSEEI